MVMHPNRACRSRVLTQVLAITLTESSPTSMEQRNGLNRCACTFLGVPADGYEAGVRQSRFGVRAACLSDFFLHLPHSPEFSDLYFYPYNILLFAVFMPFSAIYKCALVYTYNII